jgi:hypothetical protein
MAPIEKIQNPSVSSAPGVVEKGGYQHRSLYDSITHPSTSHAPIYGAGGALAGYNIKVTAYATDTPPLHIQWASTPTRSMFPRSMFPWAVRASGLFSLIVSAPLEAIENYYAVTEGRRTVGEAVVDGTVDVGIGFASATAGLVLGAKLGAVVGSTIPLLGTVVGAVAGGAIGFGLGYLLNAGKEYALEGKVNEGLIQTVSDFGSLRLSSSARKLLGGSTH